MDPITDVLLAIAVSGLVAIFGKSINQRILLERKLDAMASAYLLLDQSLASLQNQIFLLQIVLGSIIFVVVLSLVFALIIIFFSNKKKGGN